MPGTTLPNLGLTGDIPDHSIWGDEGRANDRRLDALVQLSVVDKDLASPPTGPLDGERYIVPAAAGGSWSGHDGQVAVYNQPAGGWSFYTPKTGWIAWVADESTVYIYGGASWAIFSPGLIQQPIGSIIIPAQSFAGTFSAPTTFGATWGFSWRQKLDGGADNYVCAPFVAPHDWGSISAIVMIYACGGIDGRTFVIETGFRRQAAGVLIDPASTTISAVKIIDPSTAQDQIQAFENLNIPTPFTIVPGDVVDLLLRRNSGNASDTNLDTISLLSVVVKYNRA